MRRPPLPALTVHQPWAWALAGGWKPVENRDWPPPGSLLGRYLAIHAGLRYDEEAALHLATNAQALGLPDAPPPGARVARGALVAVGRVAGAVRCELVADDLGGPGRLEVRELRGAVSSERARELAGSLWAAGPWLWVLENVVQVEPVACRGLRKLWTVPSAEAELVRAGWAASRALRCARIAAGVCPAAE